MSQTLSETAIEKGALAVSAPLTTTPIANDGAYGSVTTQREGQEACPTMAHYSGATADVGHVSSAADVAQQLVVLGSTARRFGPLSSEKRDVEKEKEKKRQAVVSEGEAWDKEMEQVPVHGGSVMGSAAVRAICYSIFITIHATSDLPFSTQIRKKRKVENDLRTFMRTFLSSVGLTLPNFALRWGGVTAETLQAWLDGAVNPGLATRIAGLQAETARNLAPQPGQMRSLAPVAAVTRMKTVVADVSDSSRGSDLESPPRPASGELLTVDPAVVARVLLGLSSFLNTTRKRLFVRLRAHQHIHQLPI